MARQKTKQDEQAAEPVTVQRFIAALADDFAQHGLEVIEQMREKTPAAYALLALQAMEAEEAGLRLAETRSFMTMSAAAMHG